MKLWNLFLLFILIALINVAESKGKDDKGLCAPENFCTRLAEEGECITSPEFMKENCKDVCKRCKIGPVGPNDPPPDEEYDCQDQPGVDCKKFAKEGECGKPGTVMKRNCRATCDLCSYGCQSFRYLDQKLVTNKSLPFVGGFHNNYYPDESTNYLNYPCRAKLPTGMVFGGAVNESGGYKCYTSWDGATASYKNEAEILINPENDNLQWVKSDKKSIPFGAVFGGVSPSGETLMISRCEAKVRPGKHITPGYVHNSLPLTALYGVHHTEYPCDDFEILTCTTPLDGLCLDVSKKCKELTKSGMCNTNATYMLKNCPQSCGKCDDLCLDMSKSCAKLAKDGECQKNSTYMTWLCPVSCGACGPDGLCLDKDKMCSALAKKGDCKSNSIYMTAFCPLSCGKCGPAGYCLDRSKKCGEMVEKGECETNKNYMAEFCPHSCGKCGEDGFCLDKNMNCAKMAAAGDCLTNEIYMAETCPISCNICGWNTGGNCETDERHMADACLTSCPKCGGKSTTGKSDCKSLTYLDSTLITPQKNPVASGHHNVWHNMSESDKFYPCKVKDSKGFQLGCGRNVNGGWTCWATRDGVETKFTAGVEVLVDPDNDNLKWVRSNKKSVPKAAVSAGKTAAGESLIVTRCVANRKNIHHVTPGYMRKNTPSTAYFAYNTKEHSCDDFDILTCQDRTPEDGLCLDRNKKCGEFAAAGECTKNPTVLENCPFSCAQCETTLHCLDRNKRCRSLASAGECEKNPEYMSTNCGGSCSVCSADCADKEYDCIIWKESGQCQKYPDLMKQSCAKSCEFCRVSTPPSGSSLVS